MYNQKKAFKEMEINEYNKRKNIYTLFRVAFF